MNVKQNVKDLYYEMQRWFSPQWRKQLQVVNGGGTYFAAS